MRPVWQVEGVGVVQVDDVWVAAEQFLDGPARGGGAQGCDGQGQLAASASSPNDQTGRSRALPCDAAASSVPGRSAVALPLGSSTARWTPCGLRDKRTMTSTSRRTSSRSLRSRTATRLRTCVRLPPCSGSAVLTR